MTKRITSSGTYTVGLIAAISLAASLSGASCTPEPGPQKNPTTSGTGGGGSGGAGGTGGMVSTGGMGGQGGSNVKHNDFPKNPVLEEGAPIEAPALFGAVEPVPGGPCVTEPTSEAMVPPNWTPLFFEWAGTADMNVFEIRLEVDNQENPLLVYTSKSTYLMSTGIWTGLAKHSSGMDVRYTIRGGRIENGALTLSPLASETGVIHIAPVAAPGSVVYWAYDATTKLTAFRGFTVGDASTKTVLTPETAGINAGNKQTGCVSCHSSAPDGKVIFYSSDDLPGAYRSVDARLVTGGKPGPEVISDAAFAMLGRHRQLAPILSKAHYSANDAVVLTVIRPNDIGQKYELIWTDLHAADGGGWGVIARNGDPRNPTSASWKHDGTEIAYVSSAAGSEGVIASTSAFDATMDIYTVPYNNRQGGDAKPLPGASEPLFLEFYPVYSPGDRFIAFNRAQPIMNPQSSYDQAGAEVFLIDSQGGTPTRLAANDPPECSGLKSPGITNSWSRWAPDATYYGGKNYYWLVFSSKRRVAAGLRAQLYAAAIVTEVIDGKETLVANYPGVYVLPQNPAESNHTPSWDNFVVNEIPK